MDVHGTYCIAVYIISILSILILFYLILSYPSIYLFAYLPTISLAIRVSLGIFCLADESWVDAADAAHKVAV